MKTTLCLPGVVALLAAAIPSSMHAQQTSAVLSVQMTTNGLANWQTIHTVVTNVPASPQAFYRTQIVLTNVPPGPTNMALIAAGSYSMGDAFSEGLDHERPVHTVNASAFWMDKHEVGKALWDEVAGWAAANGYDISTASADGKAANHPVCNVSWFEAVKWCNARSQKEGFTPCYTVGGAVMKTGTGTPDCNFAAGGFRLPTEAEWEKAARGGLSGKRFPWGDTITHSQANYNSSSSYTYDVSPTRGYHPTYATGSDPYTSPVGAFEANGHGVYDMAGNVWEWCWDWYSNAYYLSSPESDPRGPASGSSRVVRGGGWFHYASYSRAANRHGNDPVVNDNDLGFRCARSSVP